MEREVWEWALNSCDLWIASSVYSCDGMYFVQEAEDRQVRQIVFNVYSASSTSIRWLLFSRCPVRKRKAKQDDTSYLQVIQGNVASAPPASLLHLACALLLARLAAYCLSCCLRCFRHVPCRPLLHSKGIRLLHSGRNDHLHGAGHVQTTH
jgi:hypothetical protein